MCEGHIMLIYIPVPLSLAMSNLSSPMTQQLPHYQYQQHHHSHHHHQQQSPQNQQAPPQQQSTPPHQQQSPLATVSLSRNSTSIMCAAPTQTPHHAPHHHHITVAHHQTSQMNGAGGYVGAAAGFASTPGGYTSVPRLHHCNAHSFLCSNPAYHQYQVSGGCLGHPPNYVTPFVAAGHAAPILSHSASTQLLPAASHPQIYTQPAVSIGQPPVPPVQQIGPSAQQAVSAPPHALQHPQIPHPHHHHHQHHHHPHPHPHPHPHQQPTIVSPFPSHTHIHQIPHTPHAPTSTGARGSGIEVLSRGLYRSSSQGHVIGRVRRGGTLPGMGGNRRGGNTWRGGNMQPVPPPTLPPPPLPTTAAAAAAYPGILLHFLAMLSHPSLHQFNSVEPVVAPEAPDTENYEALLHLAERLGEAKPRGLIKTAIDQLPSYRYTGETCETKQTTCVICMCEFELRQMLRVLPCLHEFHSKCVDKWLKSNRTCPICRGDAGDYLKETPMSE